MLIEKNRFENNGSSCPVISYQTLDVCVPVSVKPFARIGFTKTTCCGDATITSGNISCKGIQNGECNFIVNQKICVEVPIEFGVETNAGDTHVQCEQLSIDDICSDCTPQNGA